MGEIRSAIDIAMEKTSDIKSDKNALANSQMKNEGKKAAAVFLDTNNEEEFLEAFNKASDKAKFKEGAVPVFCAAVRLPETPEDIEKNSTWQRGIAAILPGSDLDSLFSQGQIIFKQYLDDRESLYKTLEQQFMPRLKAKQEELSKRYNQNITLSLSQDPEYAAALSKHQKAIQSRYETVVEEIRSRIMEAYNNSEN